MRGKNFSPDRAVDHAAVETWTIGETMSTDQVHLERRLSQRFDFQLPVVVRMVGIDRDGYGFTQDLSGRGVFFYTDFEVAEGDTVELTLVMPSEITLTENMRVRCRAQVTRVVRIQSKFGVAVHLQGYEFLPKAETAAQVSANFPRISRLHSPNETVKNPAIPASRSVAVGGSQSGPLENS
jgi:PilZ domain-containing protein